MLLQRWEAKIRRIEKSPQPGIELTTTNLKENKNDRLELRFSVFLLQTYPIVLFEGVTYIDLSWVNCWNEIL